jgi:hypothetical protein
MKCYDVRANLRIKSDWVPTMRTLTLDDLCELAARSAQAESAVITRYDSHLSRVTIAGQFGVFTSYHPERKWPGLDWETMPLLVVKDVQSDPMFDGHPLRQAVPMVRSLIATILEQDKDGNRSVLTVFNPEKSFFGDTRAFACFLKLRLVFSKLLMYLVADEQSSHRALPILHPSIEDRVEKTNPAGFEEDAGPASAFLFDTLPRKQSLHSRNDAAFVTLRTWNKSIKKHQIAAVAAVKAAPPARFVNSVAEEFAVAVRKIYGNQSINAVVPIPPRSSGASDGLSTMVGMELAKLLTCRYVRALENTSSETGKSHPKKSGRLTPYRIVDCPQGVVLIVDDVATSGRHIELAHDALRRNGATMTLAMAWIGS